MNRDESPMRGAEARSISLGSSQGLRHCFPLDPFSGGTWLGANAAGLLLFLLNGYPEGWEQRRAPRSRGELIPLALGGRGPSEAADLLRAQAADRYGPCRLVLAGLEGPILELRSDGQAWTALEHGRRPLLFVSSGLDEAAALAARGPLFEAALAQGEGGLDAFHRSHEPVQGPTSVCMHRGVSRSVSLSVLEADRQGVRMRYWPLPPCEIRGSDPLEASLEPDLR